MADGLVLRAWVGLVRREAMVAMEGEGEAEAQVFPLKACRIHCPRVPLEEMAVSEAEAGEEPCRLHKTCQAT